MLPQSEKAIAKPRIKLPEPSISDENIGKRRNGSIFQCAIYDNVSVFPFIVAFGHSHVLQNGLVLDSDGRTVGPPKTMQMT